jgi:hypothetical protein
MKMASQRTAVASLLLVLIASSASPAQFAPPPEVEPAGPPLFVVKVNGKDGFIDDTGKLVIAAVFQKAYPFRDGLAAVQRGQLWGFIDTKGRMVIEPQFIMVGFFSEGLARFRAKRFTDPWGYIDKTGKVVVKPQFDDAGRFRNGIARVGFQTAKSKALTMIADVEIECHYRYIDREGNFVQEPSPTHYATGKPGELILFSSDGRAGYMDAKGKVVIEPQFEGGSAFSEGLACVRSNGLFGYIDRTGEWAIPPRFAYPNDFSEGLAGVPLGERGWGFIDRTGRVVIPPKFGWAYRGFRHGLAEVAFGGKIGYINKKGDRVWPPRD